MHVERVDGLEVLIPQFVNNVSDELGNSAFGSNERVVSLMRAVCAASILLRTTGVAYLGMLRSYVI